MADEQQSKLPEAVLKRRAALEGCGVDASGLPADGTLGIAFSGGGIRSATISLGIAQAFARYNRLLSFDYMSTVSGGGYFGSFLRSLYLPNLARGPFGLAIATDRGRFDFAQEVMASEPYQREVTALLSYQPGAQRSKIANPIWWLREHSRYLAPSGPTDFAFAISHMSRNWIAMIYVFFIGMLGLFTAKTGLLALAFVGASRGAALCESCGRSLVVYDDWKLSPFVVPAVVLAFMSLSVGGAFWMTEGMPANAPWRFGKTDKKAPKRSRSQIRFICTVAYFLAGLALIVAVRFCWDVALSARAGWFLGMGLYFALAVIAWAVACYLVVVGRSYRDWHKVDGSGWLARSPTAEMQRLITRWLTNVNIGFVIAVTLTMIDTAAIMMDSFDMVPVSWDDFMRLWSVAILPAAAFVIAKLPANFPGKSKLSPKLIPALSVIAGSSLFGAVAILAASVVHRLAWQDGVYGVFDWNTFGIFGLVVLLLFVLTGVSGGFINLSSLHGYYASRLTRAYLGATNTDRLKPGGATASQIAKADPKALGTGIQPRVDRNVMRDYIDASLYQTSPLPAPIHLINITLNETKGASSLVDRARKGVLLTIAPEGMIVGARLPDAPPAATWQELTDGNSEPLTVGQLCAISGAAASSGMGRLTTLGGALSLTFANIRTGYWWKKGDAFPEWGKTRWVSAAWSCFETYAYLLNEMTARYSRNFRRLYLSDGGHYENSGALELVRRGVKLIVLADNGCDPKMEFGDLEILIRTARLDLGRNIEVASDAEVAAFAGAASAHYFFNGSKRDWRAASQDTRGDAFALLLNITRSEGLEQVHCGHIVWLKPHIIEGLSADVAGYAAAHPSFPHESTGDQFFDEAQWESYRRMGVEMAIRLLADPDGLRRLIPETKSREFGSVRTAPALRTSRSPSPRPARKRSSPA